MCRYCSTVLPLALAYETFDTGWKDGRAVPFGRYTALMLDFTAPANRVEVAVEVRGRWALPMGAWYVDEMNLAGV